MQVVKYQQKARDKFENEKNTEFDYSMFHYRMDFQKKKQNLHTPL